MSGASGSATGTGTGGRFRNWALAGTVLGTLAVSGCAVTPEPLTEADRLTQASADRSILFTMQEPVTGPISLEEAVARALKYNLDRRLAVMDAALQQRQLDLSNYDMLPRLVADAGYTTRNNEAFSVSRNVDGELTDSFDATTSQDKTRFTAELGLSWNILDFGLSYYQAKQQADRAMIAEQRRRRVVHSVVQQVRAAYWQAVSAQRLQKRITPVLAEAGRALEQSRANERQRLSPLLETLRYQKQVVEIMRQLETLEQDMAIAKAQLSALMNLPPGSDFRLVEPAGGPAIPAVTLSVEEMENLALINRPELYEEAYQKRITALEARKALLRLLPGVNLTASVNHDSNSYLVNQNWAEAGARVTWNLLNVLSYPATMRVQEAQQELAETRRLALSMAALTQVHVGYRQFLRARDQYEKAALLQDIEDRIYRNVLDSEGAVADLERIRAGASAIATELLRDRAYADMQNAIASLYVSLGLDPLPAEVTSHDIPALAAALKTVSDAWMQGRIPAPPSLAVPAAEAGNAAAPAQDKPPVAAEPAALAEKPAEPIADAGDRLDFLRVFVASAKPAAN
jgi:outer membrane protein TolC